MAGTRNIRIYVSEQCFALLVDAMAAYSKKTRRFQTLRMTVQAACTQLQTQGISRDELDRFLAQTPLDGEIAVWLEVTPTWSQEYDRFREKVQGITGKPGSDKVMIPYAVHLAAANNLI